MNLQESIRRILREETNNNFFKGFDVSKFKNQDPPDNESEETKKEIKYLRSIKLNNKFFKEKDDILENFTDFLDEKEIKYDKKLLKKLIGDAKDIILILKEHYKRPRPFKLDKTFKDPALKSTTGYSYPSGHSTQSNLVSMVLGKMYPKYKKDFIKIAEDIMYSRQMAKAHYPSDIKFGKKLATALFNYLVDKNLIKDKINESLESEWNDGNYDYQHGFCHYFAYNIIDKIRERFPNRDVNYYLLLANEVNKETDEVEQDYLLHVYIKIGDKLLDSNGFTTMDQVEERVEDWYQRQLTMIPEEYEINVWKEESNEIPDMFFNNQFCNTKRVKEDMEKFLSHPSIKKLFKDNLNENNDRLTSRRLLYIADDYINNLNPRDVCMYWSGNEVQDYTNEAMSEIARFTSDKIFDIKNYENNVLFNSDKWQEVYDITYGLLLELNYDNKIRDFFYESLDNCE